MIEEKDMTLEERRQQSWERWVWQTARVQPDIGKIIIRTGVFFMQRYFKQMVLFVLENNRLQDLLEDEPRDMDFIQAQGKLLQGVLEFVTEQFDREEWMIEQYLLEGGPQQKEEHQYFIDTLQGMISDFKAGKLKIGQLLKLFLQDWMIAHVNKTDGRTFTLSRWHQNIVDHAEKWDHVALLIHNLGIEYVDHDHKDILVSIIKLNKALQFLPDKLGAQLQDHFQIIASKMAEHFARERVLIERFNLPNKEFHLEEHYRIIKQLESLRDDLVRCRAGIVKEIRDSLILVWIDHINEVDAETFAEASILTTVVKQVRNWNEAKYFLRSTGMDWLDESHRKLTDKILDLVLVIESWEIGETRLDDLVQETVYLLQKIHDLARQFFAQEEAWLALEIPFRYREHKRQHDEILQDLADLRSHLKVGNLAFSPKVKTMVLRPWINHINDVDFELYSHPDISY